MDLTFSTVFAGLAFGAIGVYLIKLGRKEANIPHIAIGFILCIYPYFIENDWILWGLGSGLVFVAYRMR